MAIIDLTNQATTLVQSTQGRAGTPDGNIYFDKTNGLLEIIPVEELPTLDLTSVGGGASDPNPLSQQDGIRMEALYAFENRERASDESLRPYERWTNANFKFAGSFNLVNSRKFSTQADIDIIRGSGVKQLATDGGTDRISMGARGLGSILPTSQPYLQLSVGGAPVDFAKAGNFDELIQVFGSTGNTPSDASAGDFDSRTYMAVSVRTFGQNYDRKESTTDLGITELGEYFAGFAVSETPHLTTGNYTLADVYGGAQIAPWTSMGLEELDTPQVETGFNEADGNFTWVLNNAASGSLDECVAFLDALAQTDDDINDHITNVTNGKRVGTWYSYNGAGQIVTDAPFSGQGLFIENVPVSDEQRVVFTDDVGGTKTRPFSVSIEATVGSIAKADANAWYHCYFAAAFNTAGAVEVQASDTSVIKGLASTADGNNKIIDAFDYDGDTVGGSAGTDKDCVYLCEGDGGATQAKTLFTVTRTTTVAFSCAPTVETNV
jgi:hypothetical protein